MKKGFLLSILGLFLCFGQASADLYTLSPTADAYVFSGTTYDVIRSSDRWWWVYIFM